MTITYTSDPISEYARAINGAETRAALVEAIRPFSLVAWDALNAALAMSDADWTEFRRGLAIERRNKFAGREWAARFGCITVPETMLKVEIVAAKFGVPWGCAYIRLKEEGQIWVRKGRAKVNLE